jgi:hypothetical protein
MSATRLYRIAAVVLVLFAAGHTFGFLNFVPPTAGGVAVRDAMNNVHFTVRGETFSYGGFYRGFGLFVTAYLLFSALLAWHLATTAVTAPQTIGVLAWGFFAVQVASLALSWLYFSAIPAIFSAGVAACLGWAARKVMQTQHEDECRSRPRGIGRTVRAAQL